MTKSNAIASATQNSKQEIIQKTHPFRKPLIPPLHSSQMYFWDKLPGGFRQNETLVYLQMIL